MALRRLHLALTGGLLAAACYAGAPTPECVSDCGMALYGSADCDGFRAAEQRAVRELGPHFPGLCKRLDWFSVQVVNGHDGGDAYVDPWGRNVAGLTYCRGVLQIANGDWKHNALAHEIAHAGECPGQNVEHAGWIEKGIYESITRAASDE